MIGFKAVAVLLAGATLALGANRPAIAADDFYAGKTVRLYIGFGPGGGYDVYGRLLARHLRRFIPGAPTVVAENMPGVGGLLVANYMANAAPKEGLSLAMVSEGAAIEQVLDNPAVRFDLAKFHWVGMMAASGTVFFTWHTSPTRTFADLRQRVTTFGSTGAGNTDLLPKAMNRFAGAKFKMIAGYQGTNEVQLAVERGEVEGGVSLWSDLKERKPEWIRDRLINPIIIAVNKRYPDLPDVPTMSDVGVTPEDRQVLGVLGDGQLGRSIFTTPDVPTDRVDMLRRAFTAAVNDPAFLQEAAKMRTEIDPLTGGEMQALVERVIATPKDIARKVAEARK